ncbi:hypothetical protein LEP1GSC061_1572 [Leptospira wolffii serovar Khorat str. Khorat-H2]|nr:hypothetical protein LEP1GSC061_1572 [Leptospira wolffii serovar Khorat str. Khorat-H2]
MDNGPGFFCEEFLLFCEFSRRLGPIACLGKDFVVPSTDFLPEMRQG